MEFIFSILTHRLSIGLRVIIDGNFKLTDEIWKILKDNENISEIVFILRKVDKFDEKGIKAWTEEVKKIADKGYTLTLIECPRPLLTPILKDKRSHKVLRSFVVTYYCSNCNEEFPQLINTNSMSLSFTAYSKPSCPVCNKRLNIDMTEDEIERIASLLPIKDTYSDKRKYPRFDATVYKLKAKVIRKKDNEEAFFDLINFSEVGICIVGKRFFEPGDSIRIEVVYKGKRVNVDGTVVWHSMEKNLECFHGVLLTSKDIFYLLIKE
ncbi:MAG: PilZ domain-containing protein [Proteobacteria bacterium]|nr:PilZ domain-containing protein [Pseudomonadota bacterium]